MSSAGPDMGGEPLAPAELDSRHEERWARADAGRGSYSHSTDSSRPQVDVARDRQLSRQAAEAGD